MNPKGENLGICGLEGIKRSPAEPSEVGLILTMCHITQSGKAASKENLQFMAQS